MSRARGNLTPKQERFVHEYLVDLNATQAAIRGLEVLSDAEPALVPDRDEALVRLAAAWFNAAHLAPPATRSAWLHRALGVVDQAEARGVRHEALDRVRGAVGRALAAVEKAGE